VGQRERVDKLEGWHLGQLERALQLSREDHERALRTLAEALARGIPGLTDVGTEEREHEHESTR